MIQGGSIVKLLLNVNIWTTLAMAVCVCAWGFECEVVRHRMIDFIAFAFMVTGWVIYFINSTTHSRIQVATSNAHIQAETDSKM